MNVTVDTNILVRATLGDDPVQSLVAARVLREASLVAVTVPALCEFVWVLTRGYKRSAAETAAVIRELLGSPATIADRSVVEAGLAFLDLGGDFADGAIAHAGRLQGGEVFVTFDERALRLARQSDGRAATPQAVVSQTP